MDTIQDIIKKYPSVIEWNVAWGEMDSAQHLNNVNYLRYSESGRIAYFDVLDFQVNVNDIVKSTGPILAEIKCKYKFPLTYPDKVWIGTKINLDSIYQYGFEMEQVIISQTHNRIAAEVVAKIVIYDYQKKIKAEFPQELKDKIVEKEGKRG